MRRSVRAVCALEAITEILKTPVLGAEWMAVAIAAVIDEAKVLK